MTLQMCRTFFLAEICVVECLWMGAQWPRFIMQKSINTSKYNTRVSVIIMKFKTIDLQSIVNELDTYIRLGFRQRLRCWGNRIFDALRKKFQMKCLMLLNPT